MNTKLFLVLALLVFASPMFAQMSGEHEVKKWVAITSGFSMAIASGLPKPQVYVIPDPDPNAFATGKDPGHASIAVTQGLLGILIQLDPNG